MINIDMTKGKIELSGSIGHLCAEFSIGLQHVYDSLGGGRRS